MFHYTGRWPSMITQLPCNFTFYTNDATYWKEDKKVSFLKLLVAWKLYVHQTKRARIDNPSCLFCHLFRAVYSIMTIFKVVTFIPHVTGEYTRCRTDSSTNSCGSFSIQQFFCQYGSQQGHPSFGSSLLCWVQGHIWWTQQDHSGLNNLFSMISTDNL